MTRGDEQRRAIDEHDGERWDVASSITADLALIRKAWPILHRPPKSGGTTGRSAPASRPPARTDALSLVAEIAATLAFWVRALIGHDEEGDPAGLRLDDTMGCARYLQGRAEFIGGWEYAERLSIETAKLAREARHIAWPKRPSILLGECTNRVGAGADTVPCGTKVRAHTDNPGDVKCRGCGLSDTIDGWMLRMVADNKPVTIPQLVPLLHKRLGIVVSARRLQQLHRAGQLPPPIGRDNNGAPTFDRADVFAVMLRRAS